MSNHEEPKDTAAPHIVKEEVCVCLNVCEWGRSEKNVDASSIKLL